MKSLEYVKAVVFRKEPSGGILFNIDTGDIQIVEGVAFAICDMIDKGSSKEAIIKELSKHYPDEKDLETDLDSFLQELQEKGAIL